METDLMKTGFFKRDERIKNPADFKKLFKSGKKISIPGAKLFYLENNLGMNRDTVTQLKGTYQKGTAVKSIV